MVKVPSSSVAGTLITTAALTGTAVTARKKTPVTNAHKRANLNHLNKQETDEENMQELLKKIIYSVTNQLPI
jgi:hypothetical protein